MHQQHQHTFQVFEKFEKIKTPNNQSYILYISYILWVVASIMYPRSVLNGTHNNPQPLPPHSNPYTPLTYQKYYMHTRARVIASFSFPSKAASGTAPDPKLVEVLRLGAMGAMSVATPALRQTNHKG